MTRKLAPIFAALLAVGLLAGCGQTAAAQSDVPDASASASAASQINRENAESFGICGENLVWYYKDHILVIRGEGPMDDFADTISAFTDDRKYAAPPWAYDEEGEDRREEIQWVFVEDGVTSIGANAFACTRSYSQLSKVVLPDSITSIGARAFSECSALTSIEMPANLEKIGAEAFYECTGLTSLQLPASVKEIGSMAFFWCDNLTEVQVPENVDLSTCDIPDTAQITTVPAETAGE